jgi:hypothetical protein
VDRVKSLLKDNNDGRIKANATKAADTDTDHPKSCWNCGRSGHRKADCPNDLHQCSICMKSGHLEKFCLRKDNQSKPKEKGFQKPKPTYAGKGGKPKGKDFKSAPKTNKSAARKRLMNKVQALMTQLDELDVEDDVDREDESDNDDQEEVDDYDHYGSEDDVGAHVTTCDVSVDEDDKESDASVTANATSVGDHDRFFHIDSACFNGHVAKSESALTTKRDVSELKRVPCIEGVTGDKMPASSIGSFGPKIKGKVLVCEDASSNLLSLSELVKHGGRFDGDENNFRIYDQSGELILHARNHSKSGGWSVKESELRQDVKAYLTGHVKALTAKDHDYDKSDSDENEPPPETQSLIPLNPLTNPASVTQQPLSSTTLPLSADDQLRAKEAMNLCSLLGHPGDQSIIDALDGNHFPGTHLTSQDFRNARRIHGGCLACVEAKMRSNPERPTNHPAPETIGDVIHIDIYILKTVSIGGNSYVLIGVDEKSGFILAVPMKRKNEESLKMALEQMIRICNTYGHTVRFVLSDDETNLQTLNKHAATYAVEVQPVPADLHEKFVENRMRTIKDRMRAVDMSVAYAPIPELECEKLLYCVHWINCLPNSIYGAQTTPLELFTRRKAFLPQYYFGQTGLFYHKRKTLNLRSVWGIFIGYGSNPKYLRMYDPQTKSITSDKFTRFRYLV